MDKAQGIHAFWSSFGWRAFDETTVPDNAMETDGHYITYEYSMAEFQQNVIMTASVWERSSSWAGVMAKSDEIFAKIGLGGKLIPIDGGYIWIKRGSPFSQRLSDDSDSTVRRVVLSIVAEYLSN